MIIIVIIIVIKMCIYIYIHIYTRNSDPLVRGDVLQKSVHFQTFAHFLMVRLRFSLESRDVEDKWFWLKTRLPQNLISCLIIINYRISMGIN